MKLSMANPIVRWYTAVTLALLLLATGQAAAAQEYGARAFGLAGAYTGAADDIASLIYNPAGLTEHSFEIALGVGSGSLTELAELKNIDAILAGEFDQDISFDLVTLGGMSLGRFGAAVAAEGFVEAGSTCQGGADRCGNADYMIQFLLGGGIHLGRLPLGLADFRAGMSIGRLNGWRITYNQTDATPTTYIGETVDMHGKGYTLHLGATFKVGEMITVGLAAQNATSHVVWSGTRTTGEYQKSDGESVGPETVTDIGDTVEKLPAVYRAGVAIRPPALGATIAADLSSDGTVRLGVEKRLLGALTLRAGYITGKDEPKATAGLGIAVGPVHLDAAVGYSSGFKAVETLVEGSVRF